MAKSLKMNTSYKTEATDITIQKSKLLRSTQILKLLIILTAHRRFNYALSEIRKGERALELIYEYLSNSKLPS